MPRIYVVQEQPQVNMSPALDYGDEFIFLLPPGNHSVNTTRLVDTIATKLDNFQHDDYLLLIGDPVAIGVACTIASNLVNKDFVSGDDLVPLKVLKWDRQDHRYFPIELKI